MANKKDFDAYPCPYFNAVCSFTLKNGKIVTGLVKTLGWSNTGEDTHFFLDGDKKVRLADIEDITIKEKKKSTITTYTNVKDDALKFISGTGISKKMLQDKSGPMRKALFAELTRKFALDKSEVNGLIDEWSCNE